MKLTVFAATGGIGRQLLDQALAAGHDVTAVVRNPAKLPVEVRAVTADLATAGPAALEPAVAGRCRGGLPGHPGHRRGDAGDRCPAGRGRQRRPGGHRGLPRPARPAPARPRRRARHPPGADAAPPGHPPRGLPRPRPDGGRPPRQHPRLDGGAAATPDRRAADRHLPDGPRPQPAGRAPGLAGRRRRPHARHPGPAGDDHPDHRHRQRAPAPEHPMSTASLVVTLVAVAAYAFSGISALAHFKPILPGMARAGVPESWLTFPIGTLKTAGAAGLLLGLVGVPWIGTAAAIGLVLFFVCAVYTHVRVRDYSA